MKTILLSVVLSSLCFTSINAQINEKALNPFIGKNKLISKSGPGLKATSGDLLIELSNEDNPDAETIMLLRNSKGKLIKITENDKLLMGKDILGVSGGNYPELSGDTLALDYTIGSNSAVSDISIIFEKSIDGNYYFKTYTSITRNYGVENLFARQQITAAQTGKIILSEASESMLLERSGTKVLVMDNEEPVYKALKPYAKYIPEGWRLAEFALGDLNLDKLKKDLLLICYNEDSCIIQLLLQQENGSYKIEQTNSQLIIPNETFNVNNLKAVIKNGYFTIEQRIATHDTHFNHQYSTFKYNAPHKSWLLHRYDVEYFSGFNPKPNANVLHLTPQNFGELSFEKIDGTPGNYHYEPAITIINGTLTQKQFYGKPNYGETPEKDEKVMILILKTDYPINVVQENNNQDPETGDKPVLGISEIQVYSNHIDLKKYDRKKVKLQGLLQYGMGGNHHTKVVMEVKEVID